MTVPDETVGMTEVLSVVCLLRYVMVRSSSGLGQADACIGLCAAFARAQKRNKQPAGLLPRKTVSDVPLALPEFEQAVPASIRGGVWMKRSIVPADVIIVVQAEKKKPDFFSII